jgi:hypothetical protein
MQEGNATPSVPLKSSQVDSHLLPQTWRLHGSLETLVGRSRNNFDRKAFWGFGHAL